MTYVYNGHEVRTESELEGLISNLDAYQKQCIRNDFHGIPNEPIVPKKAKIFNYCLVPGRPLKSIDHNTDLTITTRVKETFGQEQINRGLLLKKEYFVDDQMTDILFKVEYAYIKTTLGHLTHQSVKLTWFNEDGTMNEDVKDKGFTAYSPAESREATRKRREAVIYLLEDALIHMLLQAPGGAQNIYMGRDFLEAVSPAISRFLNSGVTDDLVEFVNLNANQVLFPFLKSQVAPGYTVAQYIIDGVSYD